MPINRKIGDSTKCKFCKGILCDSYGTIKKGLQYILAPYSFPMSNVNQCRTFDGETCLGVMLPFSPTRMGVDYQQWPGPPGVGNSGQSSFINQCQLSFWFLLLILLWHSFHTGSHFYSTHYITDIMLRSLLSSFTGAFCQVAEWKYCRTLISLADRYVCSIMHDTEFFKLL